MKKAEEGWTFPLAAPYFPEPPYHMTPKTEYIMVFFEADREALAYEIPEPLELAPDAICMAWVGEAYQPPHTHGRYHEGVVGIKVKYKGMIGWYSPYMFPYPWPDQTRWLLPIRSIRYRLLRSQSRHP